MGGFWVCYIFYYTPKGYKLIIIVIITIVLYNLTCEVFIKVKKKIIKKENH